MHSFDDLHCSPIVHMNQRKKISSESTFLFHKGGPRNSQLILSLSSLGGDPVAGAFSDLDVQPLHININVKINICSWPTCGMKNRNQIFTKFCCAGPSSHHVLFNIYLCQNEIQLIIIITHPSQYQKGKKIHFKIKLEIILLNISDHQNIFRVILGQFLCRTSLTTIGMSGHI